MANTIKCSCAELHAIINNHQESLLIEAATRVQQKVKHLSGQKKSLSTYTAYPSAQSEAEYTEHCLEHSTNDKMVCMRVEMQSQIDREIQEQQKEGENLAPVEEADMGVEMSCVEDLKQLCLTKAKIIQLQIDATIIIISLAGIKTLKNAPVVCVAGQYVYVTDYGKHCVPVFTKGEHVTTFGQKGSGDGDFNGPCGVYVDEDGFVYVCDCYNNKVQIFLIFVNLNSL